MTAPEVRQGRSLVLPALDGYRAVAALAVLLTHVSFATGFNGNGRLGEIFARGDVGVAVFFVLSGFLLYRPWVVANRGDRPGPNIPRYARRRVARIYPAYWVVLLVVLLQSRELVRGVRGLMAQVLLIHTWWPDTALGPPATTTHGVEVHPLGQAWTLAAEVVFYLALPFWAALMSRASRRVSPDRRWRVQAGGLLGLIAVAQLWRVHLARGALSVGEISAQSSWVFNHLDHFALGMAMAVVSVEMMARGREYLPGMSRPLLPAACWLASIGCLYASIHWAGLHPNTVLYGPHQQFVRQWCYGGVAAFALAPAMLGPTRRGWVAGLMGHPVLRALGRISYGIYLWQELVLYDWLRWRHQAVFTASFPITLGAVVVITVAIATVSWFLIERPALRRAA